MTRAATAAATLLAAALAAACAGRAAPDPTPGAAAPAPAPGDTLHFFEVTTSEMSVALPDGDFVVHSEHAARIGVVGLGPDSARAWYDELDVMALSNLGRSQPDVATVLGKPFTLRFTDRGVETLATPDFPAELDQVTDLRYQFADFFLPPPPEPLRAGLAWVDTMTLDEGDARAMGGRTVKVTRLRVVGDTALATGPAWRIETRGELSITATEATAGPDREPTTVEMAGTETGWFLVDRGDGRLLARDRRGELSGTMSVPMPAGRTGLPVSRRYSSRIDRVGGTR